MSDFALQVTPGLTIPQSGNWTLTPAKARLLSRPTVSYSGTFGAATVSDGTLTSGKMASNFMSALADVSTLADGDRFWVEDVSAAAFKYATALEIKTYVMGAIGSSLTPPAALTDTVAVTRSGTTYTASLQVVLDSFGTLTELTTPAAVAIGSDLVGLYDASASATKAVKPRNLVRSVTENLLTTAGTTSAYTIATSNLGLSAYASGIRLLVRFNAANAASATLNVDSVGAKSLRTADDFALIPSELAANQIAEVVYSSDANSSAGGWLVQGLYRKGREFAGVVFDGSVSVTSASGANTTNGSESITLSSHGLSNDQLIWFNGISGFTSRIPYYVYVVDTNTFKVSTSKANRAAGTYVTSTGTGNGYLYKWSSDPILGTARNIDGIVRVSAGVYRVDFTVDPADAYYRATVMPGTDTDGDTLYPVEYHSTYAATSSLYSFILMDEGDGAQDSARIRVSVHV